MMNIEELNSILDKALQDFRDNVDSQFPAGESNHVTVGELHDLAYQTNAALLSFKKSIIQYLKENR